MVLVPVMLALSAALSAFVQSTARWSQEQRAPWINRGIQRGWAILLLTVQLASTTSSAQQTPTLRIRLASLAAAEAPPCPRLTEDFLKELREILPGHRVAVERDGAGDEKKAASPEDESYEMRCVPENRSVTLSIREGREFQFRHSERAQGFLPADWLIFQRRNHIPVPMAARSGALDRKSPPSPLPEDPPLWKKWWFWAGTAVVAGAAAGLALHLSSQGPEKARIQVR